MPRKTRNLTDTQLVILSAAAQRDEGAVQPLPKGLEIAPRAQTRAFKALLKKDLVHEKPAAADVPAWRETPAGDRFMLVISPAGLDAIGVEPAADASTPARRGKARLTAGKPKRTSPPVARRRRRPPRRRSGASTGTRNPRCGPAPGSP